MTAVQSDGKVCVLDRTWLGELRYVLREPGWKPMYVDREVMGCVAVVYCERSLTDGGGYRPVGTAFLVSTPETKDQAAEIYAVTARHLIEGVERNAPSNLVRVRFNSGPGAVPVDTQVSDWIVHPSDDQVDVAVIPLRPPVSGFVHVPTWIFATEPVLAHESIGPGDEVVLAGLYSRVPGTDRNSPIMRMGNIAALLEEELNLNDRWWKVRGHLAEVRSLNGLSGSPVFIPSSPFDQRPSYDANGVFAGVRAGFRRPIYLFGLVQAHWDERSHGGYDQRGNVNEGIAVITPADSILAVLNQEALVEQRRRAKLPGNNDDATMDANFSDDEAAADDRVSLAPLDPEDVLRALLNTPPESDKS